MTAKIDDWPMTCAAEFSDDKRYRYVLERGFKEQPAKDTPFYDRPAFFIMLNPSTADEKVGDPTIRRCLGYAKAWGCPLLTVFNLFALRATDPKELYASDDPIGPANDFYIVQGILQYMNPWTDHEDDPLVVCAWGNHGRYLDRATAVMKLLASAEIETHALAVNVASGQPAHPLYLPKDLLPTAYP